MLLQVCTPLLCRLFDHVTARALQLSCDFFTKFRTLNWRETKNGVDDTQHRQRKTRLSSFVRKIFSWMLTSSKKRPRIRPRCRVSIRRKSIGYRQTHFVSDPLRTGGSSSSHFNTIGADIELSEMVPTVATLDVDLFIFF